MHTLPDSSPDSRSAVVWKYFLPLLIGGFAIRLINALYSDWYLRPDELMQYLEQAHRLVFGYGFVPWEFRYGVRTWLIPAIPALPLYITKIFAIDSPALYIPLVNAWNSLLSMSIPVGMYFYTRRAISEHAAKWALIFGCFWYEFLVFAPHALAESYATAFFMSALAIGYGTNNIGRLLFGGLLLGLTFAIRVPYAPLVAAFGIMWLKILPRRLWAYPLGGGAAGLLIWGIVDYWTWGGFWASIINYVKISQIWGTLAQQPFYINILNIMSTSGGLYAVILLIGIWRWRQHTALIIMTLLIIAIHSNPRNQEYTNLLIALPLLWMLASNLMPICRRRALIVGGVIGLISCIGLANKLPFVNPKLYLHEQRPLLFLKYPSFNHTREVVKTLRHEPVHAILWQAASHTWQMGAQYHLHRNVPIYFPNDARHIKILQESALPPQQIFSHIITREKLPLPGFSAAYLLPPLIIYRNNDMSQIKPLAYIYDIYSPFFINMVLGRSEDLGVTLPPFEHTPFRPTIP